MSTMVARSPRRSSFSGISLARATCWNSLNLMEFLPYHEIWVLCVLCGLFPSRPRSSLFFDFLLQPQIDQSVRGNPLFARHGLDLLRQIFFDRVVRRFGFQHHIEFNLLRLLPKITQVVLVPELSDLRIRPSFGN